MIRKLARLGFFILLTLPSARAQDAPALFPLENDEALGRLSIKNLEFAQEFLSQDRNANCPETGPLEALVSPAEEGCRLIRDESASFSIPVTSSRDFQRLIKDSGGMEKFRQKYGLYPPSDAQKTGRNGDLPMGFTLSADRKNVHINCFLCHGQEVAGKSVEGGSNNALRLQELFTAFKDAPVAANSYVLAIGNSGFEGYPGATSAMDMSLFSSRVRSAKTGNVDYFAAVGAMKDGLFGKNYKPVPVYAPPWWNSGPGLRQASFYSTGITNQTIGHLMQFAMASDLSGRKLKALIPTFDKILACVKSIKPPLSPYKVDPALFQAGREIFEGGASPDQNCNCAKCHGVTEPGRFQYPELRIRQSFLKTDPVLAQRFGDAAELDHHKKVVNTIDPAADGVNASDPDLGYIAPPLVGMFAKKGLLHNRSVPTVKALLCTKAADRPVKWAQIKAEGNIFDHETVVTIAAAANGQTAYDTKGRGFSNGGHDFCDLLKEDPAACTAMTEYLKAL